MKIDVERGNLYRVYAKIDLDAVRSNLLEIKKRVGEVCQIMAVVKADGYGHGAVEIANDVEELVLRLPKL